MSQLKDLRENYESVCNKLSITEADFDKVNQT